MPELPLIGEDDPRRVMAIARVIGAAVLARRMGPLPWPLTQALEQLEEREPAWMARIEDRAHRLLTTPGH